MNKKILSSEKLQKMWIDKSIEDYNSVWDIKCQQMVKDHRQEMKKFREGGLKNTWLGLNAGDAKICPSINIFVCS